MDDSNRDNIIPLKELVDGQVNVYEMTCASIKRSEQITATKNEELKKKKIKIVSEALREILSQDVKYTYKD